MTTETPRQHIEALVQRRGKLLHEVSLVDDELRKIETELQESLRLIPPLDEND